MCNKGHLGPNIKWEGTENKNPIGIEPVISWKLVLTCEQIAMMGRHLSLGIWSCDTSQWILCFQSCQPQHGYETKIYQVAGSYSS